MILGGLGRWWVVMLDRRAILATVLYKQNKLFAVFITKWLGVDIRMDSHI